MSLKFVLVLLAFVAITGASDDGEIRGQRVDVILSGRDLPKTDFWSQPDPFIKVYYKFDADSSYISYGETSVSNNNPNPNWPQSFTFDFSGTGSQHVKFELWDSDVQFDDHIGDVEMSLAQLVAEGGAAGDGTVTRVFQTINKGRLLLKTRVGAPTAEDEPKSLPQFLLNKSKH